MLKRKKIYQNKGISISRVPRSTVLPPNGVEQVIGTNDPLADAGNKLQNSWSMSQEREFIENLLCQRFSFFIIFYSIIVAGSLTSESQIHLVVILTLGTVILTLFATTLFRVQHKLDLILTEILEIPTHPITKINNLAENTKKMPWYARLIASGSRRKFIGYTIPAFCVFSLILGTVLAVLEMML